MMRNWSWKSWAFLTSVMVFLVFTWVSTSDFTIFQSARGDVGPMLCTVPAFNASCKSVSCVDNSDVLAQRLRSAEIVWSRANAARNEAVKKVKLVNGIDLPHHTTLWDLFYPSFDCPYTKERIGRVGDGGKWICGFEQLISKPKCTVFSFGVAGDTSFEEEFLRRTHSCVVHMFDPTIGKVPSLVAQYPDRAFFNFQGLGAQNSGKLATLKSIMASLNVDVIDVLKIDIEGAEWDVFQNLHEDFPNGLPFAQLEIEVHLGRFKKTDWLNKLSSWFSKLEGAGFRQFFQEPNLFFDPIPLRELAFVNIKMDLFKLT